MTIQIRGTGGSSDMTGSSRAGGRYAHAEGSNCTATNAAAHAEGDGCTASGQASHAEGSNCTASQVGAHAEGQSCIASGQAAHAEGSNCTASFFAAHAEGQVTAASGQGSHAEGAFTTVTGFGAHVEGGYGNAAGYCSHAGGYYSDALRHAQFARAGGNFSERGDAQTSAFVARRQTTDATATVLTFDGGASATLTGEATNVLTVPTNRGHRFEIDVVARRTDGSPANTYAAWCFRGLLARGSTGNARLIGTTVTETWADAAASGWTVALGVDTSNGINNYLTITVTGAAATTIRWVATICTTEVG